MVPIEQIEMLIRSLDLPRPQAALALLRLDADTPAIEQDVLKVVEDFPALSAVLRAHAGSLGLGASPERLLDAMTPVELACASIGLTFYGGFAPPSEFDLRKFWRHALACGCLAQWLADRSSQSGRGISPLHGFAIGLCHDLGRPLLAQCLPKSYQQVLQLAGDQASDLAQAEQQVLGPDHTLAGKRLAQFWRLPAPVQDAIWLHHQPADMLPPVTVAPVTLAQLADALVGLAQGTAGDERAGTSRAVEPAELAKMLGLTTEDLAAAQRELPARLRLYGIDLVGQSMLARPAEASPSGNRHAAAAAVLNEVGEFCRRLMGVHDVESLAAQTARLIAAATDAPAAAAIWNGPERLTVALSADQSICLCPCRPGWALPRQTAPAARLLDGLVDPGMLDLGELSDGIIIPLPDPDHPQAVLIVAPPVEAMLGPLPAVAGFAVSSVLAWLQAQRVSEELAQATQRLGQTREELAQAQTMYAVAEMAAGAAHELNNPLTVISGRAQLMAAQATNPHEAELAALLVRKAQDISDIATDLMAFARPEPPRPEAVDARALLEQAREEFLSLGLEKSARATVDIQMQQDCPLLWADRRQIAGVLVELARNALAAGTKPVHIVMDACDQGRQGVLIRVADDGPGMDEATLASAFTPFFSRRPAGRGRGMGLSRARRTVEANRGRIWIDSRAGHGTTVFLRLPRAEATKS